MIVNDIDKLITELEKIRKEYGNLEVKHSQELFNLRENLHIDLETIKGWGNKRKTYLNFY